MPQDKLLIFDTTLRDGEQSPGASMRLSEKVRIAKQLEMLRVDIIEAGFAIASDGDFAAIQAVAQVIKQSIVCSLARANPADIDRAAAAIKPAPRQRIHTFIATSPIHMRYKLQLSESEVLQQAVSAVRRARNLCDDVEFSCEDAGRSKLDFMCQVIEQAIDAGASTINIPDTVGYTLPDEFGALIKAIIERVPNSDKAVFSVHCHNDLGLAVANSLAGIAAGARQVEGTINGLGERAGNTALEEVIMAVKTRSNLVPVYTDADTKQIIPASTLISQITAFPVQPNKAIVGANAFAHEAGIHQDGILKHRETYEIMRAEDVGWSTNKLVLGKHSGRHALKQRLQELGYDVADEAQMKQYFIKFKALADRKHDIYNADLHSLVQSHSVDEAAAYKLEDLQLKSDLGRESKVCVKIAIRGKSRESVATGNGPVDAAFMALENIVGSGATLLLYTVNAITAGIDAQGEVGVRLERGKDVVNGSGADTNIIVASVLAYIDALNTLERGDTHRTFTSAAIADMNYGARLGYSAARACFRSKAPS